MASLKSILNPAFPAERSHRNASSRPGSPSLSSLNQLGISSSSSAVSCRINYDIAHAPHPDCPDSFSCLPDTDSRPQHTYPVILRCAILGSPKKRLTIREIYAAMMEKYPYFRTAGQTWKQSVRHHLSLNRLFEKQHRPVHDPGFGSYWTVNLTAPPGTKRPRKRGRAKVSSSEPAKKRGRPKKHSSATGSDNEASATTALKTASPARLDSEEDFDALYGLGEDNVPDTQSGDSEENYESDDDAKDNNKRCGSQLLLDISLGTSKEALKVNAAGRTHSNHDRSTPELPDASAANIQLERRLIIAQKELTQLRCDKERLQQQLDTEISKRKEAETALATHL